MVVDIKRLKKIKSINELILPRGKKFIYSLKKKIIKEV